MRRIIQNIILDDEIGNVWRFITEPKNFSKYVYGYINGKTTSPNRTGVGASYEWYGKLGPFKLKSIEKIVEWQERKHVAYNGKLFGIKFDSSMNVRGIKKQTQLTVSIEYKVPFYLGGVITDSLLIRWIIQDYIKKSLGNLKKIYNE
ncbi:MAG: SRPBCC family protein [Patescibacteria group bacterium]